MFWAKDEKIESKPPMYTDQIWDNQEIISRRFWGIPKA